MAKKDEIKQEKYYALKEANSIDFSELMIQRLGLETDEDTGYLYFDSDDDNNKIITFGMLDYFVFDGFKFVSFENKDIADGNPNSVKIFDPYNDINLVNFCVTWFLHNIKGIDVNNRVQEIAVSNNKMNDPGKGIIVFFKRNMMDKSINDIGLEDIMNNGIIEGNTYNRDCLKYMDLIFLLDEAAPPEYMALRNLDMVSFDDFKV